MKKEDLISKWLNHDLTQKELEAFKQLDAFGTLDKISEAAKHFKAPDFDATTSYAQLKSKLPVKSKTIPIWRRYAAVAAMLVICFSLYFTLFNNPTQSYIAQNATIVELQLPDTSQVTLNAGSTLKYKEKDWENDRLLQLNGEAYFKVEKGNKFTVETDQGSVTVLGTQFNVKARKDFFEVTCFEGLVAVKYKNTNLKLTPGKSFRVYQSNVSQEDTKLNTPDWLSKKTTFKNIAVIEVINEIERQYNVTIDTLGFDTNLFFTGSITHNNLTTALNAIAIPFGLEILQNDTKVTLKK